MIEPYTEELEEKLHGEHDNFITDISLDDMLEIELKEPGDFLRVKETLTRIGMPTEDRKALMQSCHILQKRGRYFIVHFKELFLLDGKDSSLNENDIGRRNRIAFLLDKWGLIKIKSPDKFLDMVPVNKIMIVKYNEKSRWNLISKYEIGGKRL